MGGARRREGPEHDDEDTNKKQQGQDRRSRTASTTSTYHIQVSHFVQQRGQTPLPTPRICSTEERAQTLLSDIIDLREVEP